jgi:exodeoxyribonuclease VII small subunit
MALEDSIKSYEKGMLLLKSCQDSLKEIEQKVLVLSAENTLEKFKPTNE